MATKNLTIRLSDQLIEASKEYAKKQGTSLNEMIREFLQRNVQNETSKSWVDELLEVTEATANYNVNYKFDRDELNER
jgi:antitoxin component of RelBE/YafQ-DinJ toxin-antitoxin module